MILELHFWFSILEMRNQIGKTAVNVLSFILKLEIKLKYQ